MRAGLEPVVSSMAATATAQRASRQLARALRRSLGSVRCGLRDRQQDCRSTAVINSGRRLTECRAAGHLALLACGFRADDAPSLVLGSSPRHARAPTPGPPRCTGARQGPQHCRRGCFVVVLSVLSASPVVSADAGNSPQSQDAEHPPPVALRRRQVGCIIDADCAALAFACMRCLGHVQLRTGCCMQWAFHVAWSTG